MILLDVSTPTTGKTEQSLWSEPAISPSYVDIPTSTPPNRSLWAEPAELPSDLSTPTHSNPSNLPPLLPTPSLTIHGHHVNDPILTPLIQSPVLNELSPIPIVYDMMNQSMLPSYTPHSNLNIRLFEWYTHKPLTHEWLIWMTNPNYRNTTTNCITH